MSEITPNTFQCFNVYVDRAMELLTDAELRCLLFATRHILGWQDKISERQSVISLSMFEHGFVSKKNNAKFAGCGLRRPAIQKAVSSLTEYGFLEKVGDATPDGQEWRLSDSGIDWKSLEARHYEKTAKGIKQVQKAAAASAEKRRAEQGGTLDVPVRETYQEQYVERTDSGTLDVQNQSHVQSKDKTNIAPDGAKRPIFAAIGKHVFNLTEFKGIGGGRLGKLEKAARRVALAYLPEATEVRIAELVQQFAAGEKFKPAIQGESSFELKFAAFLQNMPPIIIPDQPPEQPPTAAALGIENPDAPITPGQVEEMKRIFEQMNKAVAA